MKKSFVLLLLLLSVVFTACKKESTENNKPIIAVSILPQSYFFNRIAQDKVQCLVLAGEGQSPHSYEPTPLQVASLSTAGAWVLSGTDFETGFVEKVRSQFPSLPIIDGTEGLIFREMGDNEIDAHEEGHEDDSSEDEHGGEPSSEGDVHAVDKHTWLGKENAKIISSHILRSLILVDPSNTTFYTQNYDSLLLDIDSVFDKLHNQLSGLEGKSVLVFHPSFGYFLDEFGIKQLSIETGGKEPSPRVLSELIEKAKEEKIPALFVQKQFSQTASQKIALETGAKVIPLDPLSEDWLNNLIDIGNALEEVYK